MEYALETLHVPAGKLDHLNARQLRRIISEAQAIGRFTGY